MKTKPEEMQHKLAEVAHQHAHTFLNLAETSEDFSGEAMLEDFCICI